MKILTDSGLAGLGILLDRDEIISKLQNGDEIDIATCEFEIAQNLPENVIDLQLPIDDELYDSDNAIALHRHFKNLSPRVACKPALWVSLGFIYYQKYLLSRWSLNPSAQDGPTRNKINDRYLLKTGRYGYFRNAIARLWWTAHMTFDETKDEKSAYELTKLSFELQEYQFQFMLRKYGSSADVCRRILRHFLNHKSEYKQRATPQNSYTDFIKLVGKRLNLYSSVYLLDLVEESKINDFISREADAFFIQK